MIFTDQEITWACKKVLLDQLDYSKTLRESLSYVEKSEFRDFIKNLKLEEINRIFEVNYDDSKIKSLQKVADTLFTSWQHASGSKQKSDLKKQYEKAISVMKDEVTKQNKKSPGFSHADDFIDPITKKAGPSDEPTEADFDRLHKSLVPTTQKNVDDLNLPKNSTSVRKLTKPPVVDLKLNKQGEYEQVVKQALFKKFGLKGKIAIGVGLAVLLAIIGYLLYRRYKDKCRQLCSKSNDKAGCMKKCKIANVGSIIRTLNTEKAKCGANKKCIMKFEKKIRDWEVKLRNIK